MRRVEKDKEKHIRVKNHNCVKHEWCEDIFFLAIYVFYRSNNVYKKSHTSPPMTGDN